VFVALVIRHVQLMRCDILSFVAFPALRFSTLSHKRHDLGGGGLMDIRKFVLVSSTTFV
jgi:hypothetical protein